MVAPVEAAPAAAGHGGGGRLYTYSRMLSVVNSATAHTGVKLEVKKKVGEYEYAPVEDEDIEMADFDMKLGQVVKAVKDLPRERKLQFSKEMRDAGNERFYEGDHKPAIEMYAQAMAGLDQSANDPNVNKETLREIALPIMTNMAMSFLELRRPRHALELCGRLISSRKKEAASAWPRLEDVYRCDQAIKIDARCVKAHLRRSKALRLIDRYAEAREACGEALRFAETDDERLAAQSALRKAVKLAVTTKEATVVHGRAIRKNLASATSLYADKAATKRRRAKSAAVGAPCTSSVLTDHFRRGPSATGTDDGPEAGGLGVEPRRWVVFEGWSEEDLGWFVAAVALGVALAFRAYGPTFAEWCLRNMHRRSWFVRRLWRRVAGRIDDTLRLYERALWAFHLVSVRVTRVAASAATLARRWRGLA